MSKILVSACLLGAPVRYDGGAKTLFHEAINRWRNEGRLVTICPEMAGGLPTPRPPAELDGRQRQGRRVVMDRNGADVTDAFHAGAAAALALAKNENCAFALLKDSSPSCGVNLIHDGAFSGRKIAGDGITAALLRANDIAVFIEHEIDALVAAVDRDCA